MNTSILNIVIIISLLQDEVRQSICNLSPSDGEALLKFMKVEDLSNNINVRPENLFIPD